MVYPKSEYDNQNAQHFYDATNKDVCIPPMFQWDSYFVHG